MNEGSMTQEYILDGIDNDSIEWNDFDMIIFEFCDLWARMFNTNAYAMCFMGIAGYLTFRSHVKKLFGWWCHCPNDDLSDQGAG